MEQIGLNNTVVLRGVLSSDAPILFPLIYNSTVTDTIVWDGPVSLAEYQKALLEREQQHRKGEVHFFTIVSLDKPVGTVTIRPENEHRANIGLWIGSDFHGKGIGTEAVRIITDYGFEQLKLQKIEASIFIGNQASRRIFENNGYILEGVIRSAVKKRGQFIDEWLMGIVR